MNKIFRLTIIVFAFLLINANGHAAEVVWQADYFEFEYSVEPNGGTFVVVSPLNIQESSDTEDFFFDEVEGSSGQFTSVANGDLDTTSLGWDVQMRAMAKGPDGGVNPANGTLVQAFTEIDADGLAGGQGVSLQQESASGISRRFSVDTDYNYEVSAFLSGVANFVTIEDENEGYRADYTIDGSVVLEMYADKDGTPTYVRRVELTDTEENDIHFTSAGDQMVTIHLSPTTDEGEAITYELRAFLSLRAVAKNYSPVPAWTILGPLTGPYQLGSEDAPFKLGVTVLPVNIPPVADAGGDQGVSEGTTVTLDGSLSDDLDGTIETYSWTQVSGTSVDISDASLETASFEAPTYAPEDPLNATGEALVFQLEVTDNRGDSSSDTVIVNVSDVNQAPVAEAGDNQTVDERTPVTLDGSASQDPDGSIVSYSWVQTAGTPVTLSGASSETASFDAPSVGETETVVLEFELEVTDDGGLKWTDKVRVTAIDVNEPPVLDAIGDQSVNEGELLQFVISATDPEGDNLTYSATGVPDGATFDSGTHTFTWTPDYDQAGTYAGVNFTVTDDGAPPASDSETITITVIDVNRAPVLNSIGNQHVDEEQTLEFTVTATDPDGDGLTISADPLPSGTSFTDNGDGTATFGWTPVLGDDGNYTVLFTVTDDADSPLSDSEQIIISVGNVFIPPALSSPENGQTGVSLTPTLAVNTGGAPDPGENEPAQTEWQISETSDFSSSLPILEIKSATSIYSLDVPDSILAEGRAYYWRVRFIDSSDNSSDWSVVWSFTTETTSSDENENGIPDDQEADSSVDLNDDGIPDVNQPDVIKCVEAVNGNGQIGVVGGQNVASIESVKAVDADIIANKPADMPLGLVSFKLKLSDPNNREAKVDIYLSSSAANDEWWKYDSINGWQDYSSHAVYNAGRTVVTLTLEDGGFGDADGSVNGIIVDPSGPAALASSPPPSGGDGGGGGGCFIATSIVR